LKLHTLPIQSVQLS